MNIFFLIGFMGSGKTHWGKKWAALGEYVFIDMDEVIEKKEGMPISTIFEQKGESYFRNLETEVLHSFEKAENVIISCGGGTPCFNDNMDWMNKHGVTIYLQATPKQLALRLRTEKDKRPLLKDIPDSLLEATIQEKLAQRESVYLQAKIILESEVITTETFSALQIDKQ